jgi:hypothetical protein
MLRGAFPFVLILVQRRCAEFFRVTVRWKQGVPWFGPVGGGVARFFSGCDGELPGGGGGASAHFGVCVVSGEAVGDVVRVLAVRADLACQVMHDGQVRSCVSVGSVALTVVMVGTALVCVVSSWRAMCLV